jgi:hypothetical protein
MTSNFTSGQTNTILNGFGFANTIYNLNNPTGTQIKPRQPVIFYPDMAGQSGYQALNVPPPTGYTWTNVIHDPTSGLDLAVAYNQDTNTAVVTIAGINGFGTASPGSGADSTQAVSGFGGQVAAMFNGGTVGGKVDDLNNGGILQILQTLSQAGAGSTQPFSIEICAQSGGGEAADALTRVVSGNGIYSTLREFYHP